MMEWTANHLHETCKDLMAVVIRDTEDLSCHVEFLHRTVSDFLRDDRVLRVIEQQAPDHFSDPNFLFELGKLRCLSILHMIWKDCYSMERVFASMIEWSQSLPHCDRAWLVRCEECMTYNHEQMEGDCRLYEKSHPMKWVEGYTKLGLTTYLSVLITSQPNIVARSWRTPSGSTDALVAVLSGWLTWIFAEPHVGTPYGIAANSLHPLTDTWVRISSSFDEVTNPQRCSTGSMQPSFAYMLGNRRMMSLGSLLNCGIDPNRRCLEHFERPVHPEACVRSVWQNWLRAACLRLRLFDGQMAKLKQPSRFSNISEHAKTTISGIVATLLQHGADPTCSICISHHDDGEACQLVSLECVLSKFASQNNARQLQALRVAHSGRFSRRTTRQNHMLRAMRSWKTSIEGSVHRPRPYEFLEGFARVISSAPCECSSNCARDYQYVTALCLECTGGYFLCRKVANKRHHNGPTQDEVSKYLVHEFLPSDSPHEFVSFGYYTPRDGPGQLQRYGIETSMAILEDWYARNTMGEDAALD